MNIPYFSNKDLFITFLLGASLALVTNLRSKSLSLTSAINGTLTVATSPFWGYIFDCFIFHETPSLLSLMGTALICLSTFMIFFGDKEGENAEE